MTYKTWTRNQKLLLCTGIVVPLFLGLIYKSNNINDKDIADNKGAINPITQEGNNTAIGNLTQNFYTVDNIIKENATPDITNKLLRISKIIQNGQLTEAGALLDDLVNLPLNKPDLTNVLSVKASLYLIQGKLPEAKAVYESILYTQIKSNAVYIGLATISAFEAFGKQNFDPEESKKLLYQSNDWYFKAVDLDKRPQILATIYYGIYDNYKIIVNFFKMNKETTNLIKYKELFEDFNKQAGYPFGTTIQQNNIGIKTNMTKDELTKILKERGIYVDLSSIPDDSIINGFSINTSDSQKLRLDIDYSIPTSN